MQRLMRANQCCCSALKRAVKPVYQSLPIKSTHRSFSQTSTPTEATEQHQQHQKHEHSNSQSNSHSNNQSANQSEPSATVHWLTWLSLIPVLYAVNEGLVTVVRVEGRSMQPTLNPSTQSADQSTKQSNDWVLVWRPNAASASPRGSVVIVRSPYDASKLLIKRLVAKEGDWLESRKRLPKQSPGRLASAEDEFESELHVIGRGRVWLEGENALVSGEDSVEYGEMFGGLIEGRGVCIVWPPQRWQVLRPTLEHVGGEQRIRNARAAHGVLHQMIPVLTSE